jgi:hypothetical protein
MIGAPMRDASREPVSTRNPATIRLFGVITIFGGILLGFGSLLPWTTATFPLGGTISIAGTEGDGIATLVLGVIIGAVGFIIAMQDGSRIASLVGVVAAIVSSIVVIGSVRSAQEAVDVVEAAGLSRASLGIGLWVVSVGAIGAVVGTVGSLMVTLRKSGIEPPT